MLNSSLRRVGAALAAVAIGLPALAVTTASAEPVFDPPLTATAGTSWTDGPCAEGTGVTVVTDHQGDSGPVARCVTNEDGSAYASANALQSFADAGIDVRTQTSAFGPMICMVEGAPDPCGQWPGDWWSFWTGTVDGGWVSASAGAHDTTAATDTFIALSLAGADQMDAPAPRVGTVLLAGDEPTEEEPAEEDPAEETEPGDDETVEPDAAVVAAADFLARELRAQDHLIVNWGFNDYGLTTDFALALAATGLHGDDVAAAAAQVAETLSGYVGTDGETYAGAVAKSLVLAVATGVDPSDFGGVDLVATLQGLEQTSGDTGRFSDVSEYGDYSNTLVQSFAIIGLEGAGAGASQEAVEHLLSAQCPDGGFALTAGGATCMSDPDATALAVQALIVSPCATDAALTAALGYLRGLQAANGGFGGGATTEGVNANSTGLIGATLATAGLEEADAAAEYLLSMQYGEPLPASLHGGFAYDSTVLATRTAAGAEAAVIDQDRRTTVQAVLGLTGTSYADLVGARENAPERECDDVDSAPPAAAPPAAPPVAGPVIETDIVAGSGPAVAPIAAGLLVLAVIGGTAVATGRRSTHR